MNTIYLENPFCSQSVYNAFEMDNKEKLMDLHYIVDGGMRIVLNEFKYIAGQWIDKEFGMNFGNMWRRMPYLSPWRHHLNNGKYLSLSMGVMDDPEYIRAVLHYDSLDAKTPRPVPTPPDTHHPGFEYLGQFLDIDTGRTVKEYREKVPIIPDTQHPL